MQRLSGVTFFLCLVVNNGYGAENSLPAQQCIMVTEKCYQDWQNIRQDAGMLAYYFKGVFKSIAIRNDVQHKPSALLKWLRDENFPKVNEGVPLTYKSAEWYMRTFIKDEQCDTLDALFLEKYNVTKDIPLAWKCVNKSFCDNVIRKSMGAFCKDMLERDAAKLTLAEHGMYIDGRI